VGRIFVGTSGWLYEHWRGIFYPAGLPSGRRLAWLAGRFATVEVNGTFYSLTRPAAVAAWRASVPAEFVFAIKASRYITHMLKLAPERAPLGNFFAQGILLLGRQLGPILWQLPPTLRFDRDRASRFFDLVPDDLHGAERAAHWHDVRVTHRSVLTAPDGHRTQPLRHALEVRHASWVSDEARAFCIERGLALVTADTAGHHPFALERTADFAYLRLHGSRRLYGSRYSDRELGFWAGHLRELASHGDVYVYFDNDRLAYAPADALRLIDRLHEDRSELAPVS
jgi:uncharacterized protein YecE (DUF72 family)